MGVTKLDSINSLTSRALVDTAENIPTSPTDYYGSIAGQDFEATEWRGGELFFSSDNCELHVQTATSGATATWVKLDTSFDTTSTTSSTSTTTSTTSTSSSTSTTTSTSTSTSSSTSTSTSTSSTTTAGA